MVKLNRYCIWFVYSELVCCHQHFENNLLCPQLIDSARDILDTELTAMASESYQRAYNTMVTAQMLAELEEVIQYNVVKERREDIKLMWWERLKVQVVVNSSRW
jgi:hypothetical protein